MSLTKEQWQAIEERLSHPWGSVELKVPGHVLTIQVRQIKPLRYAPMLFVDGVFKGEWTSAKCEDPIAQRFYPLRSRAMVPRQEAEAQYKRLKRVFPEKEARLLSRIDARYSWRDSTWSTARAICTFLKKSEPEIQWLEGES